MAITQDRVRELFDYKDDGTFIRKETGKLSVCNFGTRKYLRVAIDGKATPLHRLIYLYHYGVLPNVIDHIDNDRSNNRIENLRAVTQQQNCLNRVKHANGKTPFKNVYLSNGKWSVQVNVDGKRKYFGVFDDVEFADLVATEARNKFHGEYARHA